MNLWGGLVVGGVFVFVVGVIWLVLSMVGRIRVSVDNFVELMCI